MRTAPQAAVERVGCRGRDLTSDAAGAAIIIECLPEKHDVKHAVFAEMGALAADDAVLVTTATALSVTDLALSSGRPNRVLGLSLPHDPAPHPRRTGASRLRRRRRRGRVAGLPRRPGPGGHGGALQAGLHRRWSALRLPEPRRDHVRGGLRQPRRHRRRHALRLWLPGRAAGAAGQDRSSTPPTTCWTRCTPAPDAACMPRPRSSSR